MAVTDRALVAHLFRRAGFGLQPSEVTGASHKSWKTLVGELVDGLSAVDGGAKKAHLPHLTTMPEANAPGYNYDAWDEYSKLITWWTDRMVVTETPLKEKLVLLLHRQFPTSWDKVYWASMMHAQNEIFRTKGAGNFETLVQTIAKDPAMLIWLDTDASHKDAPNQNFPRELMERFTMGVGNYTQEDVIQASRCFTGWELDRQTGRFYFNAYDHDNGVKTFLGRRGRFTGEDVIHFVTRTAASHRWVTARLWSWLAYPVTPHDAVVAELAAGYGRDLHIGRLLEAILMHPAFRSTQAVNGLVKQPIEWIVGAMRLLGLRASDLSAGELPWLYSLLGQIPFTPPSVGGWGANQYWQSTGGAAGYIQVASALAGAADLTHIEAEKDKPATQVALACELLGLSKVSPATRQALERLASAMKGWTGSWPSQQIVTLALLSPEFAVN